MARMSTATGILVLVFVSGAISGVLGNRSPRTSAAADRALESTAAESLRLQAQARADIEATGAITTETRENGVKAMDAQLARAAQGDHEAAPFLRAQRVWLARSHEAFSRMERASTAAEQAPGRQDLSFSSREQLDHVVELSDETIKATIEHQNMWRNFRTTFAELMRAEGCDETTIRGIMNHITKSLPILLRLRELEVQHATDSRDQLQILRDQWGFWRLESETVLFEDASACERFGELSKRIEQVRSEVARLNAELVKAN